MSNKNIFARIFFWILFITFFAMASYGFFLAWKISKTERKITIIENDSTSFLDTFKTFTTHGEINLKGLEKERMNILLLGIAGKGKPGQNLADTIIVASIEAKTGRIALLSIPRDLYVEIPDDNIFMKINSVYEYGLRNYSEKSEDSMMPFKKVIKNITSLDIDYWAVINFEGFQKTIDAVGGINIINERDIYDPRYPGPNYSYETFELSKGLHHLDGKTALKYARMRHNDPEGDFGRAKRQQQVMQATKNKIFSTGTYLNVLALNELFNTLGENIKTNISNGELGEFLKLIRKLDTNNINNVVLKAWDKESLLKVSHVFYGDVSAFVLIPRVGDWSEVRELSQNIFDINKLKRNKEEISKEGAIIVIINKSGNSLVASRILSLMRDDFEYKNLIILSDSNKKIESESITYDLINKSKPFTLNEIAKKLPTKIADNLPSDYQKIVSNIKTDFVVIIGKDLTQKYNMEINTIEEYNKASDTNDYTEFRN